MTEINAFLAYEITKSDHMIPDELLQKSYRKEKTLILHTAAREMGIGAVDPLDIDYSHNMSDLQRWQAGEKPHISRDMRAADRRTRVNKHDKMAGKISRKPKTRRYVQTHPY